MRDNIIEMLKKILKLIFDFTGNFLMVLAFLALVFFAASKILPHFNYYLVVIQSGSMRPNITEGSIVFSQKSDDYVRGDIVTFYRGGNIITHRVEAIEKNGGEFFYKTKGDANNSNDLFLVAKDDILGKAVLNFPYLGYLAMAFRTKIGFGVLVVIPTIWVVTIEIGKIRRYLNNRDVKPDERKTE